MIGDTPVFSCVALSVKSGLVAVAMALLDMSRFFGSLQVGPETGLNERMCTWFKQQMAFLKSFEKDRRFYQRPSNISSKQGELTSRVRSRTEGNKTLWICYADGVFRISRLKAVRVFSRRQSFEDVEQKVHFLARHDREAVVAV